MMGCNGDATLYNATLLTTTLFWFLLSFAEKPTSVLYTNTILLNHLSNITLFCPPTMRNVRFSLSCSLPPSILFSPHFPKMARYSCSEKDESKLAKSRGSHLRIHFKHCREITHMIKGMTTKRAVKFMTGVLNFEEACPFSKYTGGIGHHAMAKQWKAPGNAGRWPVKATKVVLDMLRNAEANAVAQGLDTEKLYVYHSQANRAPGGRRRTYRAHGRIGPYMSEPAHVEIVLKESSEGVKKSEAEPKEISKKQASKNRRVKIGGGVTA